MKKQESPGFSRGEQVNITVTTQDELDAAIEAGEERIIIDSPAGVWLEVRGSSYVEARGSSHVDARESSRVEARGSSYVAARGSSHVVARGSSYVVARGSSHVDAWESSRVEARGSSRVVAWESSRVEAWESSRVEARESSHVDARESSRCVARDDSRVEASPYVTVHLHSTTATVTGGVIIDIAGLDLTDARTWCDYHGVPVSGDTATVYKAVSLDYMAGQGRTPTRYEVGSTVTATDWDPAPECGRGLHFSPTPRAALRYYQGEESEGVRYLACEVDVAGLVALGDKVKARSCRVVGEVDEWRDPIGGVGTC